jgi:hypothetical protein
MPSAYGHHGAFSHGCISESFTFENELDRPPAEDDPDGLAAANGGHRLDVSRGDDTSFLNRTLESHADERRQRIRIVRSQMPFFENGAAGQRFRRPGRLANCSEDHCRRNDRTDHQRILVVAAIISSAAVITLELSS